MDWFNEPQPDITLLRTRDYRQSHPTSADVLLLIEVSDTTLRYDREIKLPLYARAGIIETWILDIRGKQVEIYREAQDGEYRQIRRPRWQDAIAPQCLPEMVIRLAG